MIFSQLFRSGAADAPALPIEVPPTDPHLHYQARLDPRDPARPRFDWAGSSITIRLTADAVNARLASSGADRMQVEIDGAPGPVLVLEGKPRLYALARGLSSGPHTVSICKRTEPLVGTVQFLGLQLSEGAVLLDPPRSAHKLEFIGDSITAGYGNEATRADEHFSAATENNCLAWSGLTARMLGADYLALALSGSRLTERPGDPGMPAFYRRTLFTDPAFLWNFKVGTPPNAVVINLGTNDFFQGFPSEAEWTSAYHRLLDFVRGNYPEAQVWLAIGPMMEPGEKLDALRRWNDGIVAQRHAAGDLRLHTLEFPTQRPEDGYGADSHPSLATHRRMAEQMSAELRRTLGW